MTSNNIVHSYEISRSLISKSKIYSFGPNDWVRFSFTTENHLLILSKTKTLKSHMVLIVQILRLYTRAMGRFGAVRCGFLL